MCPEEEVLYRVRRPYYFRESYYHVIIRIHYRNKDLRAV